MEPSLKTLPKLKGITRIVFTGDVFRIVGDEREPHQLPNVFWLHNLLSYQLTQITGLIPEICFGTRDDKSGRALITEAHKILGLRPVKAWQNSFWHKEVPSDLIDLFRPDYDQALVLGFELSPIIESILNRMGCPWIDVAVSPIRFLDDLLLSVRLSDHFKSEPLLPFTVSQEDIACAADYVRRWFKAKNSETILKHDDVVFFGQTEGDRTLITCDGSFFSAEDTVAALADLAAKRRLWIKPHPCAPQNPVVQLAIERLGGQLIKENAYWILSADADIEVATVSSSIGHEAPWFGKRTKMFCDSLLHRMEAGLAIRDSYCFSDFWRVLLEQIMPISFFHRTQRLDIRHPALRETRLKPNVLREQLGFWGMPPDVWAENASTCVRSEIEYARELQHARAEIAALRASNCWRVTAPLRWLSSHLRSKSPFSP